MISHPPSSFTLWTVAIGEEFQIFKVPKEKKKRGILT